MALLMSNIGFSQRRCTLSGAPTIAFFVASHEGTPFILPVGQGLRGVPAGSHRRSTSNGQRSLSWNSAGTCEIGSKLARVSDNHRTPRSLQRANRVLRQGLTCLVNEQPANRFAT